MGCHHAAIRLEKMYPENKNTSPLQTVEYILMISIISSARSALPLNNHTRVLQNNKKCDQKHLMASALDVFVSLENKGFNTLTLFAFFNGINSNSPFNIPLCGMIIAECGN